MPCLKHVDFCQIFPVSGRFLYFENTIKYTAKLPINQNRAQFRRRAALMRGNLYMYYNQL